MMVIRRFLQYGIAGILLATGIGKLLDVPGFIQILTMYQAFPEWALQPVAVTFVLIELKLAESLLSGKSLPQAAFASLVLHGVFTLGSAATMLRGINVPNCGCFGVFWARPLTWVTVGEDLFMVVISFALYRLAAAKY